VPVVTPAWLPAQLKQALQHLRLHWPPDEDTLRAAYRRRSLALHPDKGGDHEGFVALQDARDVVAGYLERGLPPPPPPPPPPPRADSWTDFRRGFRRSRRGNLWQRCDGETVTVFARRGRFHWCVAVEGGRTFFSRGPGWADEEDALRALWRELN
jgi:hypothetical protein